MLGCILFSGDILIHVFIHSRKTVDHEMYSKDLKEGIDVVICYSKSRYIAVNIFEEWIEFKLLHMLMKQEMY